MPHSCPKQINLAQNNFDTQQLNAYAKFKLCPKAATTDFDKWVVRNEPTYVAASKELQSASGAWYQAMTKVFGPDAATVKGYVDNLRLSLANDMTSDHARYNELYQERLERNRGALRGIQWWNATGSPWP